MRDGRTIAQMLRRRLSGVGRGLCRGSRGFTLIEILAALAIASVIILATAGLTHNVALFFDRGTRNVGAAERLMLAVDRLAGDFGSARFVYPSTAQPAGAPDRAAAIKLAADTKPQVLFTAEPGKVTFVAAGGVPAGQRREEVITLTVEQSDADGVTRLVRRRAAWPGPRTPIAELGPDDPVVLIEGHVDIAFAFGRAAPDGSISWTDSWADAALPRFVRLTVRDRATGVDLLANAQFVLHADAPMACSDDKASAGCVSGPAAGDDNPAAKLRGPQPTEGQRSVL